MICSRCLIDQPRDQFGPSADMYPQQRECKRCGKHRAAVRRHGLDVAQRRHIAENQGGCRICGHPEPSAKGWVVDHDRACCPGDKSCPKCRRGVICQWCNSVLGYAFDRPQTLLAAAAYLDAPRSCDWHKPIACAPSICDADIRRTNAEDELTEMASPEMDLAANATRTTREDLSRLSWRTPECLAPKTKNAAR